MSNDSTKSIGPFTLRELAEHEAKRAVQPAKVPAPWDERHRRAALRRTFEIAAEIADTHPSDAEEMCMSASLYAEDEERFRCNLHGYADIDAARVDREVRRVRSLAEGRLVRETTERWEVVFRDGGREGIDGERGEEYARQRKAAHTGAVVVRVRLTRIHRA